MNAKTCSNEAHRQAFRYCPSERIGLKNALSLLLLLGAGAAGAFAQGKVSLQMDLPVELGPANWIFASDYALANEPVPNNGNSLPSHIVLSVGLYGGTSSTSLSLVGSVLL